MAQVSGTYSTYDNIGIREDLSDVIYNISPTATPFMQRAGRGKADNTFFEWQVDSLAAVNSSNVVVEGDEASFSQPAPTTRLGNYTQISRKTAIVSGTNERVRKAGRKSEMGYQIAKRSKELKRDMETMLLANNGAVAGDDSTARETAGLGAFVKTNTIFQTGGTPAGEDPSYTNIPTDARTDDGTPAAFTEDMLKAAMQLAFDAGAEPTILMVGAHNKTVASGFTGIATKTWNMSGTGKAKIVATADVYVSDFGTLQIIPNRFQRARDAWLLDFEFVSIEYLRPFKSEKLAKTGDAEKRMIIVEYGLKVKNEAALAGVFDLTTS